MSAARFRASSLTIKWNSLTSSDWLGHTLRICVGSLARNQTVLFTTTCGIFERKFSSQLSKSVVTNLFTPWGPETQPSIGQVVYPVGSRNSAKHWTRQKQGFKCSHAGHLSRHETDWDVPKVPADDPPLQASWLACLAAFATWPTPTIGLDSSNLGCK